MNYIPVDYNQLGDDGLLVVQRKNLPYTDGINWYSCAHLGARFMTGDGEGATCQAILHHVDYEKQLFYFFPLPDTYENAPMRPSREETFMELARAIAKRSTCQRLQVGCVLTDPDHQQVWLGYNGGAKGGKNRCLRETEGKCGCLHAEINATIKAPQGPKVAYITHNPCEACATALVNSGVTLVIYDEKYRSVDGISLLQSVNVEVRRLNAGSSITPDPFC